MGDLLNTLIILGLLVVLALGLIILYRKTMKGYKKTDKAEVLPLEDLIDAVRKEFTEVLRVDIASLNLNRNAIMQAQRNQTNLRLAYRNCSLGDLGAKNFVKDYIKDMLEKKFNVNAETIDRIISFRDPRLLSSQDKGEILLAHYKKKFRFDAFINMVEENNLISDTYDKGSCISKEAIAAAYENQIGHSVIAYPDKLAVLSQRIYQRLRGNGVVDEIRDQRIDGISGGVSGVPAGFFDYDSFDQLKDSSVTYSYESVYVMFRGKNVRLDYLSFGNQLELERVCKNIYRFDNPGQLSKSNPRCVNKMADGSRVVVVRPDLADSWMFWVRKFDTAEAEDIHKLLTSNNSEAAIETLKFIAIGEQTAIITGMQGTGKTTMLKSMCQFIRKFYNIRVQEMAFELWLRKTFNLLNVASFQEGALTGQEGLDLQKKTDGDVNIIGEIATTEQFAWIIQTSGTASRFSFGTQHSGTTKILVNSGTSALMQCYGYTSEKFAMDRVVQAIRFDVHLDKDLSGFRYISRITEIVPGDEMGEYTENNIIEYHDGKYYLTNAFSPKTQAAMMEHMLDDEKKEFMLFLEGVEKYAA